jgi:hypothetical protein
VTLRDEAMTENEATKIKTRKCDVHGTFSGWECRSCERELVRRIREEYERKLSEKERADIEAIWRTAL